MLSSTMRKLDQFAIIEYEYDVYNYIYYNIWNDLSAQMDRVRSNITIIMCTVIDSI